MEAAVELVIMVGPGIARLQSGVNRRLRHEALAERQAARYSRLTSFQVTKGLFPHGP